VNAVQQSQRRRAPRLLVAALQVLLRMLASRAVRLGFIATAATLGALAITSEWQDIRHELARLSPALLGLACVTAAAAMVASMAMWRMLLADLGSPLRYRAAARVLFVSQLGKYLPGSVWPALAQMELGRDHGVPRRRAATAFALASLFTLATGLVVAGATLPFVAAAEVAPYRWAFLVAVGLVGLLHPRLLNPLLDRLLRLARRPPLDRPLTLRRIAAVGLVSVGQWLLFGLHAWLLAVGLGGDAGTSLLLSIGGFALAWSLGYLFVIAPAGIGVREVVLAAALSPVLGRADAIVLAVVSRMVLTIVDFTLASLAAAGLRGSRREPDETRG
jgi:uncharacterized membrane protein YbhN (UPF0104 family)